MIGPHRLDQRLAAIVEQLRVIFPVRQTATGQAPGDNQTVAMKWVRRPDPAGRMQNEHRGQLTIPGKALARKCAAKLPADMEPVHVAERQRQIDEQPFLLVDRTGIHLAQQHFWICERIVGSTGQYDLQPFGRHDPWGADHQLGWCNRMRLPPSKFHCTVGTPSISLA